MLGESWLETFSSALRKMHLAELWNLQGDMGISRAQSKTNRNLHAIFRVSATFNRPPGRADLLSMLNRSAQSKMGAEAAMRSSHLVLRWLP